MRHWVNGNFFSRENYKIRTSENVLLGIAKEIGLLYDNDENVELDKY